MPPGYRPAVPRDWFRGVLEQYVTGSDTRGRQEGLSYLRSQQAIHEISGLSFKQRRIEELWPSFCMITYAIRCRNRLLDRIFHELLSARPRRWVCHRATAGCWFRGVPERYVAGADTRGRREGRPYPWSQQVVHGISGLKDMEPLRGGKRCERRL